MNAAAQSASPSGFERVSKDRFFMTVGPMNVHPRVDAATLSGSRARSDWEAPDRVRHGVSFGHGDHAEFFIRAATPATPS